MDKFRKTDVVISSAIFFSYIVYFISTLAQEDLFINITSPITTILIVIMLIMQLKSLGPFKWSSVFMALGILTWSIGDLMVLYNSLVLGIYPYTYTVTIIYSIPNIFFAICITVYMVGQLYHRKTDLLTLLANSFCICIIGFVIMYMILSDVLGGIHTLDNIRSLVYFFIDIYVMIMCYQMFYLMGIKNIFKGTTITGFSLMAYSLMDFHYNYLESIGEDPENIFIDLIYMACLIGMAAGTTIQLSKKYKFEYKSWDYSAASTKYKITCSIAGIIFDVAAMISGLLGQVEGFYIIIALLSYMIMTYILRSNVLSKQLLDQEIQQNAILEERIKEKTQGLEAANARLQQISSVDVLTGLFNRRYAWEYLADAVKNTEKLSRQLALFSIDLNNFKPVNDTYGHEMGDKVLEEFGKRLRELPAGCTAFRLGGDEFLVCLESVEDPAYVGKVAEVLHSLFNKPVFYETYVFHLSSSIGIALYPDDSKDIEILVQYADAAMYTIKHSKNKDRYCFFDSNMVTMVSKKNALIQKLKDASLDDDFTMYLQPQVNTIQKRIVGIEAYPHLSGDMENISPSEIVPIAEETGLMRRLGIWLIENSIKYVNSWEIDTGDQISLTVNLSPLQLIDANFVNRLEQLRKKYSISSHRIILDVANEVIMGVGGSAKEALKKLHDSGYTLSLNDFGGDDINLSYVLECGFDDIKLSRKLVSSAGSNENSLKLIKSILGISASMGINVIAVGIETEEEARLMEKLGITTMQGYLYGKPIRSDLFKENLKITQKAL